MQRRLSGPKVFKLVVRVDDEFLRRAGIELAVTARCLVEADHLHADDFGDVDAVPQDGLHQRAVVLHDRRLAGEEAVRLGPAQAEADAQRAVSWRQRRRRPGLRSRKGRECRFCRPRG